MTAYDKMSNVVKTDKTLNPMMHKQVNTDRTKTLGFALLLDLISLVQMFWEYLFMNLFLRSPCSV
jgi:hypothetical protein